MNIPKVGMDGLKISLFGKLQTDIKMNVAGYNWESLCEDGSSFKAQQ